MRNLLSGGVVAAALGTALLAAGAFPASAQVARPQSALAGSSANSDLLTTVAMRRSGGGGGGFAMRGGGGGGFAMRGGGGRNFAMAGGNRSVNFARASRFDSARVGRFNHVGDGRRVIVRRSTFVNNGCGWNGCGWGVGTGLALGYGLGYGLASSYPYYGYSDYGYGGYGYGDYAYSGDSDNSVAYCMSRFRTYNPNTGTYTGSDGLQHSCP